MLSLPAYADIGIMVDASTLRFIYTKGAGGPGSIGRISIVSTATSAVEVQQLELGTDRQFGGGDDTLIDLARERNGGFSAVFSADVFQLGTNDYSIVGSTVIRDVTGTTKVQGDFASEFVDVSNGTFSFGGALSNADGVLRPGSPNMGWTFVGNPALTPNTINGLLGGADGIDGTVQFIGNFPDLDAFFNSAVQASTTADIKVATVVPAPGAFALGAIGLCLVNRLRRRFSR